MRINTILAGQTQALAGLSQSQLGQSTQQPQENQQSVSGGQEDSFVQGEWWKNQARAVESPANSVQGCNCGQCPACASRSYALQGQTNTNAQPAIPADGVPQASEQVPASPESSSVSPQEAGSAPTVEQAQGAEAEQPGPEQSGLATGPKGLDGEPLSQAEQMQLAELRQVDTEVRAHEMAHLAAAGAHARSGMSFQYQKGPDGKSYAIGGEVSIDTSKAADPAATISKMQTVRAAALAPANPSAQDRKVAARAAMTITEATQEMRMVELEQSKKAAERQGVTPAAGQDGGPTESTQSTTGSGAAEPASVAGANQAAEAQAKPLPGPIAAYAGKPQAQASQISVTI